MNGETVLLLLVAGVAIYAIVKSRQSNVTIINERKKGTVEGLLYGAGALASGAADLIPSIAGLFGPDDDPVPLVSSSSSGGR